MPSLLDLIALAILALSVIMGLWRGVVYEIFAFAGWVAAYFAAQHEAQSLALLLPHYLPLDDWGKPVHYALAFVLIFIAVLLLSSVIAWALKKAITATGLKPVDRTLGGAFGLARGLLILLVITAVVLMTPLRKDPKWQGSLAAPLLTQGLFALKPHLPVKVQHYIEAPQGGAFEPDTLQPTQPELSSLFFLSPLQLAAGTS